jgi:hypothetical protein
VPSSNLAHWYTNHLVSSARCRGDCCSHCFELMFHFGLVT